MGAFSYLANELDLDPKHTFKKCFDKTFSENKENVVMNFIDFIDHEKSINIDITEFISKFNTDNLLIVNAWDCHSFVGNGNSCDKSLDG
jgi:hypothetical protein